MQAEIIHDRYLPALGALWHNRPVNMELIRRVRGLTQNDLATLAGVSQPTIARIENGSDAVTLRTLRQIADALGVNVSDLFDVRLTAAEQTLLETFRNLSPERQAGWLDMARLALQDRPAQDP